MSGRSCDYSPGEERLNVLTHAAGAVLALGGMALVPFVVPEHGVRRVAAFAVYLLALFGMYLASSCYHAARTPERKALLRRFDHAAIYLLIAGTYTPLLLTLLPRPNNLVFTAAMWAVAAAGILMKMFWLGAPRWLSTTLYILMGWAIAVDLPAVGALPLPGIVLLVAGGLAYTVGGVIYMVKRPNLSKRFGFHEIFHLFVIAGSVCHYLMVLLYIV